MRPAPWCTRSRRRASRACRASRGGRLRGDQLTPGRDRRRVGERPRGAASAVVWPTNASMRPGEACPRAGRRAPWRRRWARCRTPRGCWPTVTVGACDIAVRASAERVAGAVPCQVDELVPRSPSRGCGRCRVLLVLAIDRDRIAGVVRDHVLGGRRGSADRATRCRIVARRRCRSPSLGRAVPPESTPIRFPVTASCPRRCWIASDVMPRMFTMVLPAPAAVPPIVEPELPPLPAETDPTAGTPRSWPPVPSPITLPDTHLRTVDGERAVRRVRGGCLRSGCPESCRRRRCPLRRWPSGIAAVPAELRPMKLLLNRQVVGVRVGRVDAGARVPADEVAVAGGRAADRHVVGVSDVDPVEVPQVDRAGPRPAR